MKRILFASFVALMASEVSAQTVKNMNDLKPEQKSMAVSLKLTGELSTEGNSDYRQLRDLCFQLRNVDLTEAQSTVLPKNAFHSRHQLEHIQLPATLESIGTQAFFACDNLREIVIPQTVSVIGAAAFSGCSHLAEVEINGTPQIGEYAFARLTGLRTVKVNSKVPPKADASAFYGINRDNVKLVVPKGSESAYRKAAGWKLFFAEPRQSRQVCNPEQCLVPAPLQLTVAAKAKALEVKTAWNVVAAEGLDNEAEQARQMLSERIGKVASSRKNAVQLSLALDETLTDDEAYTLNIDAKNVTVKGRTAKGVFYGLMTLDQLLRGNGTAECVDAIPALSVNDQPRTHVRELMVDPARIFIPFNELKAFVPEMARYKLNALHLHLVDDQAWRIEIKKYPQLTAQASSRWGQDDLQMPISGYYTQDEMCELVKYAARYHVEIVPEIEMPGHEVAAISVFPELTCHQRQVPVRTTCGVSNQLLCPGNEFTYEFLGNVFKELADIFPSKYIHLGGDEAGNPPLDCWTDCPKCQALKAKLGITSTDRSENWRLQGYLFDRMIELLRDTYGKTPMFWYESDFKKIQPGCVTFAWRTGQTQEALDAAVRNNARIMLCPGDHCYFDYPMANGDMPEVNWGMPATTLKDTYALDPAWGMDEAFEKNNLFGVAGTLWSECITTPERIYYQAYPRAIALAEVGWSSQQHRSWKAFLQRLRPTLTDMMRRGITFSMELGDK
jgi:hexosaminidase